MQLCNVEKEMAGMRTDVRSILGMLAGGNAHGKRSIDQLQRWGQGRGELSNSYDEYEDDDDKDEEDEDDEDYEEAKARGENARGRAEGVIAARSEPASRTSSPKLGGQAGADRKEMRASSEGGRVVDGRVFMDLAWKIFERYDVDERCAPTRGGHRDRDEGWFKSQVPYGVPEGVDCLYVSRPSA